MIGSRPEHGPGEEELLHFGELLEGADARVLRGGVLYELLPPPGTPDERLLRKVAARQLTTAVAYGALEASHGLSPLR